MENKLWVCREKNAEKEYDVIFGMDNSLHRDFNGGNAGILKAQHFAITLTFALAIFIYFLSHHRK